MGFWRSAEHFLGNAVRYSRTVRRSHQGGVTPCHLPVVVINLERSVERRVFMDEHLRQRGFRMDVFPAVDGRTLDIAELEKAGIYDDALAHKKFARSLSPSEIGATLSHLRVCEKVVSE